MFLYVSLLTLTPILFAANIPTPQAHIEEHKKVIVWDTPEGLARLERSRAKNNFWKLLRFYESQPNLTYCGVATAVIALNALGIQAPKSLCLGDYTLFMQNEFFSEQVAAVVDKETVEKQGLSLFDLSKILQTFPLKIRTYEGSQLNNDEIRLMWIKALNESRQCILVMYDRKGVDQVGFGHWSPVAAYDHESDSFLVLDVARFKYPPVWIDALTLFRAMQLFSTRGLPRGFLIVEN